MRAQNFLLLLLVLFVGASAQARVFRMEEAGFGSYLKTTYVPWGNAQTPFSQSSGDGVSFNDGYNNLMSYEFGMMYNASQLTWRFGIEIISPANLVGVRGTSGAGVLYYTMDSTMSVVNPKIGLEMNLKTWAESRLWLYADYGSANLTLNNTYRFTGAGTAQFGITDFREEIKCYQNSITMAVGFESLLSDSNTYSVELGYRLLWLNPLNHNIAATTFQGAVNPGTIATTNSGGQRDINMNGAYIAFGFRLWVY